MYFALFSSTLKVFFCNIGNCIQIIHRFSNLFIGGNRISCNVQFFFVYKKSKTLFGVVLEFYTCLGVNSMRQLLLFSCRSEFKTNGNTFEHIWYHPLKICIILQSHLFLKCLFSGTLCRCGHATFPNQFRISTLLLSGALAFDY